MKLYTEEQVKHTLQLIGLHIMINEFIKKAEPIELPSDEEIREESIKHSRPQIFINGAEYIKKQINKK